MPIHAYVSVVPAEVVAGRPWGNKGTEAHSHAFEAYCVCSGRREDMLLFFFFPDERIRLIFHRVTSSWGVWCALVGVKGADQQGKLVYFCFSGVTTRVLTAAAEDLGCSPSMHQHILTGKNTPPPNSLFYSSCMTQERKNKTKQTRALLHCPPLPIQTGPRERRREVMS